MRKQNAPDSHFAVNREFFALFSLERIAFFEAVWYDISVKIYTCEEQEK